MHKNMSLSQRSKSTTDHEVVDEWPPQDLLEGKQDAVGRVQSCLVVGQGDGALRPRLTKPLRQGEGGREREGGRIDGVLC